MSEFEVLDLSDRQTKISGLRPVQCLESNT